MTIAELISSANNTIVLLTTHISRDTLRTSATIQRLNILAKGAENWKHGIIGSGYS